jgi:hypothetical protein
MKADLDLVPTALTHAAARAFSVGANWTPLYGLSDAACATCHMRIFNVWETFQPLRSAYFRAGFRGNPVDISGVAKLRLASYYYDGPNVVYDQTWGELVNVGGQLSNTGFWINGKLNAMMDPANNPVGRQYFFYVEVWGAGQLYMARIETQ